VVSRETKEPEVEQNNFPYEFAAENPWSSESSAIDAALLKHGAVLFKNFGIDTMQKFQNCMNAISGELASYVDGNSPRTKMAGSIYTSTEYPPEVPISFAVVDRRRL
jgi:alpha-ketoglutarate-dependent taurine dioxygenase